MKSTIDRDAVKQSLEQTFRQEFPTDTVDISDGYQENIHVLVVSRRFDDMEETAKNDMLWNLIDESGLNDKEIALISLIQPICISDIK